MIFAHRSSLIDASSRPDPLQDADAAGYAKTLCDLIYLGDLLRSEEGTARRTRGAEPAPGARGRRKRSWQHWSRTSTRTGGDHRHLADPEATGLGKAAERGLPVPAAAQDAQACPQREPRALRMKALIGEMQAPPTLDLDDPALPPHRMEVRRLGPTPSGP